MKEIYPYVNKYFENKKKELAKLDSRNRKLIESFMENLFAKGNKVVRVSKLLGQLLRLEKLIGKDLDKVENSDVEKVMAKINQMDYTEYTKKDYWRLVKQFYGWLWEEDYVKKIKLKIKYDVNKEIKRESILTEEDIQKVLEQDISLRDKAFISLLYETGCRIGEILTMTISSVSKEGNLAKVKLRGKTGERDVLIVSSVPHLFKYLSEHPFKSQPDQPLWFTQSSYHKKKEQLGYVGAVKIIRRMFEKAGIKKQVNPHFFRHSRATILANHLTEVQLCLYFGWAIGSKQVSTYVHASGRDVDHAIKSYHNIEPEKEKKQEAKICSICNTCNENNNLLCYKCGSPLTVAGAIKTKEIIDNQIEETMKFFIKMAKNPELMARFDNFKNSLCENKC